MKIEVFESQVSHVSDALRWRDGGSRHLGDAASGISDIFEVIVTDIDNTTGRLRMIHKPGTVVLDRPDEGKAFPENPGEPSQTTEEQRSRPDEPPYDLSAVIRHPSGRYNPRAITLSLGSGEGHDVWLYPALCQLKTGRRALFGSLVHTDGSPARWALMQLTVEYAPPNKTITFYAQADINGDFELPLTGLPPKAKEIDTHPATLVILAAPLSADEIPDPDTFDAMDIAASQTVEEGEIEYQYGAELSFALNPDQRTRLVTSGSDPERLVIRQHED